MTKNNNVLTVRLSEDVLAKLEELIKTYDDQYKRIGGKNTERREIVEEAIRELYFKRINETKDADVVERVNGMIDDKINSSMNNLNKKIDDILFLTIKNDLGNKLLYRSPGIIPPPPSISDAIKIIVEEESGWNNALEEYLYFSRNATNH